MHPQSKEMHGPSKQEDEITIHWRLLSAPEEERTDHTKCGSIEGKSLEGFITSAGILYASGSSELGVVVPTGFEPVFKDDYDFAFIFTSFGHFLQVRKGYD